MKCLFALMLLFGCYPQLNTGMVTDVDVTDSDEAQHSCNSCYDEAGLANQEIADRYRYWIAMTEPRMVTGRTL